MSDTALAAASATAGLRRVGSDERMFFIVGRGRSGSTLLARMLDAHPAIAVAEESLFIMSLAGRYGRGRWDARRVRRFSRDLWYEERMRRWGLQRDALEATLAHGADEATFPRLCADVYAASAAARGKGDARLLGDKNPHYGLLVPALARLFPRARFIHLVRDYRDNILSYRSVRFDLSSPGGLAYRWKRYNEAILAAARAMPDRCLRVRYEDLVASPESELRRICRFLGVPFTAEQLRFHERGGRVDLAWHRNASRPPDLDRAGRWRTRMTAAECAAADRICQPLGEALGYAPSHAPVTVRARGRAAAGAVLGGLMTDAEELVFRVPLPLRAGLIRLYRLVTGNRIA